MAKFVEKTLNDSSIKLIYNKSVKNAGIELGKWGIKTNANMETNIKGIYAIGDCAETVSLINHRHTMMQLSSTAYRQGMVAGANTAGWMFIP